MLQLWKSIGQRTAKPVPALIAVAILVFLLLTTLSLRSGGSAIKVYPNTVYAAVYENVYESNQVDAAVYEPLSLEGSMESEHTDLTVYDGVYEIETVDSTYGTASTEEKSTTTEDEGSLMTFESSSFMIMEGGVPPQPHGNYIGRSEMCKYCHSAHTGRGRDLISAANTTAICIVCHDGTQSSYSVIEKFTPALNPSHHRIPQQRQFCVDCHNPHFSPMPSTGTAGTNGSYRLLAATDNLGNIITSGNEFCWACHGVGSQLPRPFGLDHQTWYVNSAHNTQLPYPASGTNIRCINCHDSHGSPYYPLLPENNKPAYCIGCHQSYGFTQWSTGWKSRLIPNSANVFEGTVHNRVLTGRNACLFCHNAHGTQYPNMLVRPFSNHRYDENLNNDGAPSSNWRPSTNEVCFLCHDYRYYRGTTDDPIVGSKFGNGNGKNLHWHVTKYRNSCRVCHDPHGAENQSIDKTTYVSGTPNRSSWDLNNPYNVSYEWSYAVESVYPSNGRLAFVAVTFNSSGDPTGFSCFMDCGKNHDPKSYLRIPGGGPTLQCMACHDYKDFERNSAHPVVYPGEETGTTVECLTCHDGDHTKHTTQNPYGLWETVNWSQTPVGMTNPTTITDFTTKFCYHCHGDATTRSIRGDNLTYFANTPHAYLSRGSAGLYVPDGSAADNPCLVCHYAHSSTNVKLLRKDIDTSNSIFIDADTDTGKINSCLDCHDGSPGKVNIERLYNAPRSAGHFIKAQPDKKLLCTECHAPHGTTNAWYLLDHDKYNVFGAQGNLFPSGIGSENYNDRLFCMSCHPASDATEPLAYDTQETIKVGTVYIQPMPTSISGHSSTSEDSCYWCHDPHKPWPATGSNRDCYTCHGKSGEAQNIESLMGWEGTQSTGKPSRHKIYDPNAEDTNTCMIMCHTAHPHKPRANSLKAETERGLCLSCHDEGTAAASPKISEAEYAGKPHDYETQLTPYTDGSAFTGNCNKCHLPHGSDYAPLLRWENGDRSCFHCHDGVVTGPDGNPISDIKTVYNNAGHFYRSIPGQKLHCSECHVTHGSSNVFYLRDNGDSNAYENGTVLRPFPSGMGSNYSGRQFCTTCHLPYDPSTPAAYILYKGRTAPAEGLVIPMTPLVGRNGMEIPEHWFDRTESCDNCHSAHDPAPVGFNTGCYDCHGGTGYATNVDSLMGLTDQDGNTTWPDGMGGRTTTAPVVSYHRIKDADTVNNDCMRMCHTPHTHRPRANLIKDVRAPESGGAAPNLPTGLTAVGAGQTMAEVFWTPSDSPNVAGYYLYRNDIRVGVLNSSLNAGTLRFYDGGLTGLRDYSLAAFDKAGNLSFRTNTVSVTPSLLDDQQSPSVPTDLKANARGASSIELTWSRSSDNSGVKGYNIYRSTDGNIFTLIGFTGGTSFRDGAGSTYSLQSDTTYYYRVSALDITADYGGDGNESAQTAVVFGKTAQTFGAFSSGTYTSGNYKLEFLNAAGQPTNEFSGSESLRIRFTSPHHSSTGDRRRVELRDTTGSRISINGTDQFTMKRLNSSSPYVWEVTIPSPPQGLYTVYLEIENPNLRIYETVRVGFTNQHFRFYRDAGYTVQASEFRRGETVYVEVFSQTLATFERQISSWTESTYSASFTSPSWHGMYLRYSFVVPSSIPEGNWYNLYNRFRNGTETRLYKQFKVYQNDTTPPSVPTLSDPVAGDRQVALTWSASTPDSDLAGYTIYRSTDGGSTWQKAGGTNKTTTNFTDTGLKPSTTYHYRISAYDEAGNAATSTAKSASTPVVQPDTTAPARPSGVSAKVLSDSEIRISWSAAPAGDGVAGYSVYRIHDGVTLKVGSVTGTSFTDTGLSGRVVYSYRVEAYDNSGNVSELSSTVTAQTEPSTGDSLERALCMTCHDGTGAPAAPGITTAYNESKHNVDVAVKTFSDGSHYYGNCTKCHVPHGSQYDNLLVQKDDNELCFRCHTSASGRYSGRATYDVSLHAVAEQTGDYNRVVWWQRSGQAPGSSVNVRTAEEFEVMSGWTVHAYEEGVGLVATQTTDASGIADFGTALNGKSISFEVVKSGVTLQSASEYFSVLGGDLYDASYERVAPSGTPRVLRGRSGNARTMCFNCHEPHGRYTVVNGEQVYVRASLAYGDHLSISPLCLYCHADSRIGEWYGEAVYRQTAHGDPEKNLIVNLNSQYRSGDCTNCHDSHGTQYNAMLNGPMNVDGPDKNSVCLGCHNLQEVSDKTPYYQGTDTYNASAHGQRAQWFDSATNGTTFVPGNCRVCHNSHGKTDGDGNVIPKMLVMNGAGGDLNAICHKCHDAPENFFDEADSSMRDALYYPSRFAYDPVTEELSIIRKGSDVYKASTHGSNAAVVWPGNATFPTALTAEYANRCINCHNPHGSTVNGVNLKGGLLDNGIPLCLTCHDGSPATAVVLTGSYGHPFTGDNAVSCTGCHNVHSSDAANALKGAVGLVFTTDASNVPQWTSTPAVGEIIASAGVCLNCHGIHQGNPAVPRSKDILAALNPTNASHHGIFGYIGNSNANSTTLTSTGVTIKNRGYMLCTDCHDGAHTSTMPYMLKQGSGSYNTAAYNHLEGVCLLCHKSTTYKTGNPAGSRFRHEEHSNRSIGNEYYVSGCRSCHGGTSGGVHGSNKYVGQITTSDGTFNVNSYARFFQEGRELGGWRLNSSSQGECWTNNTCGRKHDGGKTYSR